MAITEYKTGTATISTAEYSLVTPGTTLAADTTDGVYQVFLDCSAMGNGDEYAVAMYEKCISSSSKGQIYGSRMEGAQSGVWVSPSIVLMHGWDITVKKIAGTDRSFSWSIRQVA
jgi:hypothetical protein